MIQVDPSAFKDTVITVVAVASLILSVYTLYLQRKDRETKVHVYAKTGFLVVGRRTSETMIIIEVGNAGEKNVTLTSFSFPFRGYTLVCFELDGTAKLPIELGPGKGATFWAPAAEIAVALREKGFGGNVTLKPSFCDAVGKRHNGKGLKFNINSWLTEAS